MVMVLIARLASSINISQHLRLLMSLCVEFGDMDEPVDLQKVVRKQSGVIKKSMTMPRFMAFIHLSVAQRCPSGPGPTVLLRYPSHIDVSFFDAQLLCRFIWKASVLVVWEILTCKDPCTPGQRQTMCAFLSSCPCSVISSPPHPPTGT